MSAINNVAVAGASGRLGRALVKELLEAGFSVTALTRQDSDLDLGPDVKVVQVDYNNLQSLTEAVSGHDALVSTVTTGVKDQQKLLVDAAIAGGVKRLVPSEFGCDLENAKTRALPAYSQNVEIENDIEKKCKGTQTTYTYIFNNALLDWGIDIPFLMDLKGKKMELFDGGNQSFTATPVPFVAAGVRAVLQHPEETANKAVRLQGVRLTQHQLLKIAQRVSGADGWEVTEARIADLERESYQNLEKDPGNVLGWIIGFFKTAIYKDGYGGDFSQNNENKMLGLTEMSEKEVEELIRSRM